MAVENHDRIGAGIGDRHLIQRQSRISLGGQVSTVEFPLISQRAGTWSGTGGNDREDEVLAGDGGICCHQFGDGGYAWVRYGITNPDGDDECLGGNAIGIATITDGDRDGRGAGVVECGLESQSAGGAWAGISNSRIGDQGRVAGNSGDL